MTGLFVILLGLAPSMVWMYWIWRKDRFQREPVGMVLGLFFGGGLIAVMLTLVAVSLYDGMVPATEEAPITNMLLTAALPEELFKLLPVLLFAWRSKHWDEPFDGIVYAGATALGFNLIESVLYMLEQESLAGSIFQGVVRGTLGGHMVYGIIMGFFLSRARFAAGGARLGNFLLAIAVPVTLHTAWNSALSYGGDVVAGNPFAAIFAWGLSTMLWLTAFELIRRNRDVSRYGPMARTIAVAPTGCWNCHGAYPAPATFCQTCGAQVAQVPAPAKQP